MFAIRNALLPVAAAALVGLSAASASAGTVIVSADDWVLSDTGFAQASDAGQLVENIVAEFGTNFLAYSNNFSLTQSSLQSAMTAAGASYVVDTSITFDLATISAFDAIFLGGLYLSPAQLADLSAYVAGSGNVYIAAGTGVGGAGAEADAWNSFLQPFGIALSAPYTGVSGVQTATSADPLFAGVGSIFVDNPNGLTGGVICCGADNLFAVSREATPPAVPLPAGGLLLASVVAAGFWRGLRRRS